MPDTSTLLLIDDCAADRKIYRRYLLKDPHQSYKILEADSAEEGLAVYKQMHCDVILLDFCLPDLSGLEFLNQLQQHKCDPVSVIMLTGRGDEEIAVQAMKRGVQDYLVKQYLQQDILQLAVRNALKHSNLQAQLSKTQERQRLIATTALRIRQSLNLEQILHTAVAEVQQLLLCDRVVVYQFVPDRAIFNVYEAGLSNCCLKLPEQFHTKANLAVPINLSNDGKPNAKHWGMLIAHQCSGERQWQASEQEMLFEVSVQLAIAIQQAELLAQTQAALEKEKQLNRFKSQIVATVSHEYRTPLTAILAAASTLKQHGERLDKSKQQRLLQIIEHKARQMSKLVDEMLVVNQFELDKTKFKPIQLDPLQFFSDLIEELRETASDRHELIFQMTGNNQGFSGDPELLRQIFVNLMSNAIKYSPDGGNVEFHLIALDSQVIFSVKDRGIGIPIDEQKNLFQSFSRGSNVDTIPGTGLGLAITKACVELHGGEITLESQVGQGTKVTVSLPQQQLIRK